MKKAISLLLAAVILCGTAALFTGCHGSRGTPQFAVPEAFDESRNYEITFWAKNDTNKAQTNIYHKAIEDFEALYPNVKVNLRLYTDYGRIYNDVITNIATGTTPNVCVSYPDHIATYLTGQNVVTPLDALFASPAYGFGGSQLKYDGPDADEMIDKYLEECTIAGTHDAVPYMRSTEALYVNVSMLEKMGYTLPDEITWDFIWKVSDEAAKKDADGTFTVNGQKTMLPFIYKSTDNMMIQMLRQKNAPYSTAAGEIQIFNDTTKDILFTVRDHVATGAFSTFKISSYPGNFLNAGQCIFALDSTGGSTWIGTHAPLMDISPDKVVDFETAVLPMPQLNPEEPWMISQGPSVCIFNKADPQEVLASWLFVQFLMTDKVQIAYSQTEGYVPVTTKAQNAPEYLDYLSRAGEDYNEHYEVKIAASKLLLANIDHTFITPVFNGSSSLRSAAGQLIENVTKSMRRKETVDEAYMEKLYQDVISLYRLDQISYSEVSGKAELGPLPKQAVTLLTCLAVAWALIAVYALWTFVIRKKK